ncbi:MAG: hypothetical protein APF78_03670 [Sphingomonadales bacterium BRH_c3]|nr:MAG: hypothetical protein APF78_03670 [Sphingomonadales bacterium BRH_c3]
MADSSDGFVWITFPDEGARVLVVLLDEAIDGRLQGDNGVEDRVFQPSPCQLDTRNNCDFDVVIGRFVDRSARCAV